MTISPNVVHKIAGVAIELYEDLEPPSSSEGMKMKTADERMEELGEFYDNPLSWQLEGFINILSDQEKAELSALYWVGSGRKQRTFDEWIAYAKGFDPSDTADYLMSKRKLGEHLLKGLEMVP